MAQITRSGLKNRVRKHFPHANDKTLDRIVEWVFDHYSDLDDKVSSGMVELYVESYRTKKLIVLDEVPMELHSTRIAGKYTGAMGDEWNRP